MSVKFNKFIVFLLLFIMKQYRYYGDVEVGFLEDIDTTCREKGV
jgi:hypothetical protein